MFGQNPIRKGDSGVGDTLEIIEIFPTIQGEGPSAGQPAIFIRLAGCNLACTFCDTQFEEGAKRVSVDDILSQVHAMHEIDTELIVITGGEPLRQNIGPLCESLLDNGWMIQIETAGTIMPTSMLNLITQQRVHLVCSPKTRNINPVLARACKDFKYIIRAGEVDPIDGLPNMSTQLAGHSARIFRPFPRPEEFTIWLQPCDEYGVDALQRYEANRDLAVALVMKFGYRLSLQLHKIAGLP